MACTDDALETLVRLSFCPDMELKVVKECINSKPLPKVKLNLRILLLLPHLIPIITSYDNLYQESSILNEVGEA